MKKWWREWALIDVLALGTGLILVAAYIVMFPRIEQNSPIANLWPNIATEVVGVWLAVRIIDQLLERRRLYHESRRFLVNDFSVLSEQLSDIFPLSEYASTSRLVANFDWLNERYEVRRRYLSQDERDQADRCLREARTLVLQSRGLILAVRSIASTKSSLELLIGTQREPRDKLQELVSNLRFRTYHDALEEPVPVSAVSEVWREQLQNSMEYLSRTEYHELKTIFDEISRHDVIDAITIDRLTTPAVRVERIYIGDIVWYGELGQAQELISRDSVDYEPKWRALTRSASVAIEKDQDKYPQQLLQLGTDLLSQVLELGISTLEYRKSLEDYTQHVEILQRNVSEETEI